MLKIVFLSTCLAREAVSEKKGFTHYWRGRAENRVRKLDLVCEVVEFGRGAKGKEIASKP